MALKTEAPKPETEIPEMEPLPSGPELSPGFHVMHEDVSLGCYPTAADAEAFADAHPRPAGLTVTIFEV